MPRCSGRSSTPRASATHPTRRKTEDGRRKTEDVRGAPLLSSAFRLPPFASLLKARPGEVLGAEWQAVQRQVERCKRILNRARDRSQGADRASFPGPFDPLRVVWRRLLMV